MEKFKIRCLECGRTYPENKYVIKCSHGCNAMLRTEYTKKRFEIAGEYNGIWKYIDWLPIKNVNHNLLEHTSTFSTHKSEKLAEYLGLENLIISRNTYSNNDIERMITGSFKDIEAEVTFQRIMDTEDRGKPIVLASDGNIATSFIHYSNIVKYPIVLVATEEARQNRIWSYYRNNPYVVFISLKGNFDYYDSIYLANQIADDDQFILEGGALNVARRDGVGTILLDGTMLIGQMPDHYFQALGSGPGAVAIYEASLRLRRDGRFGSKLPKIHAAQNYPFVPMYDAWKKGSREIDKKYQEETAKNIIKEVFAHVLTNRHPVYSIKGGVFDALTATSGEFYSITNEEAERAQILFKKLEGYTIVPPAAVTVASLIKAVKEERVNKDDYILLNITGGGRDQMPQRFKLKPTITITDKDYDIEKVKRKVKECLNLK